MYLQSRIRDAFQPVVCHYAPVFRRELFKAPGMSLRRSTHLDLVSLKRGINQC